MKKTISLIILATNLLFAGSAAAQCSATGPDIVCTDGGAVRGVAEGKTLAFKGIPYAMPPVGAARWQPPREEVRWNDVRDGSKFGPECPQLAADNKFIGAEDCLTLNVWRPKETPAQPLPVMVWLTGGGNHQLSGKGNASFGGVSYDGETLVERGNVVYVSYNLRLGALGFLAHQALDAESPDRVSGNYGSRDQTAMLGWLKRNIAAFGGDPRRIFLFGTSAGGGNICALMTAPAARELFHGAAMQSSVPTGCEIPTLADMEKTTGARVVKAIGCEGASNVAACLRGKSVEEVVRAVPGTFGVFPRIYGPNVDGKVFTDQPLKLIAARHHQAMPIIIGNTSLETMGFVNAAGPVTDAPSYAAAIEKVFGTSHRDAIITRYPPSDYGGPRQAFVQLTTDAQFTCQTRRVARTLLAAQREPVYVYFFNHALENDPAQKALGATHTVEHPFFFGWRGKYRPTDGELDMQSKMIGYWSGLARAGRPVGGPGPEWSAYSREGEAYLEISPRTAVKASLRRELCDFWDTIPLTWPHL
jgi:para-nitrobenzyl esterase